MRGTDGGAVVVVVDGVGAVANGEGIYVFVLLRVCSMS